MRDFETDSYSWVLQCRRKWWWHMWHGIGSLYRIITDTYYRLHWPPAAPGNTGGAVCKVCFGTTFIDHWSDQDQDQSDDDCDVTRMARDTSVTSVVIMTSAILMTFLTFLTPGHLGSPVPLTTLPGQDDERQLQEKLLWVENVLFFQIFGSDRLYI